MIYLKFKVEISKHPINSLDQKNVQMIMIQINHICNDIFYDCIDNLGEVLITDDDSAFKSMVGGWDEMSNAKIVPAIDGKYNIVLNYDGMILDNGQLGVHAKNTIFHEFQHLEDKKYDSFIANIPENTVREANRKEIGKTFFKEFNAFYKAQLYEPLTWEENYYSLDTFVKWCKEEISVLKKMILSYRDVNEMSDDIDNIAATILNFSRSVMYKLALACGANCGDNVANGKEKTITLVVGGIDQEIDEYLKKYIEGLNEILNDDKKVIVYSINNCMGIYDMFNQFYMKKVDTLLGEEKK